MIEIQPRTITQATVKVPGSKSLTQRALIAAALAEGDSELLGPLASEDTNYTMAALAQMGITVDDSDPECWKVSGSGGAIATPSEPISLGNNGTATRFLTSVASLGQGTFHVTGSERMQERPIAPLMEALTGWQVNIASDAGNGCPPLTIQSQGISGGSTLLPEGKSSQYLSSLLLVAPYATHPAELKVAGQVFSRPYVEMTLAVMADFGIRVEAVPELNYFRIPQGTYSGTRYAIEGDASGASYFWAAAAISGGTVTVANVPLPSLQGDTGLVPFLARMGCKVEQYKNGAGITVTGPERLEGIEVDMGDMPDVAPTLAIVAAFAEGKTTINNIAHLRIKECDRISATVTELRKLGVSVDEEQDKMIIHGQGAATTFRGAEIHTYDDHRMAMCFGIAGLRIPGVKILDEGCVKKSFPDFWERLALLS